MNKKAYIAPSLKELSLNAEQEMMATSVTIEGAEGKAPVVIDDETDAAADSHYNVWE